jgi:hypothetical protein
MPNTCGPRASVPTRDDHAGGQAILVPVRDLHRDVSHELDVRHAGLIAAAHHAVLLHGVLDNGAHVLRVGSLSSFGGKDVGFY